MIGKHKKKLLYLFIRNQLLFEGYDIKLFQLYKSSTKVRCKKIFYFLWFKILKIQLSSLFILIKENTL